MVMRQIAGIVARRIVCDLKAGSTLERGEIFGMIKFGSRTEIELPVDSVKSVKVTAGDKVFAGETVIMELV